MAEAGTEGEENAEAASMSTRTSSVTLVAAPSFDLLVVGCGGGPAEDNLSAYLVKPKHQTWKEGCLSVDGGSCLGALTRLLEKKPAAFVDFDLPASNMASPLANAGYVFGFLHSFLVTHAHWGLSRPLAHLFEGLIACTCAWSCGNPRRSLDHVAGLVLASGSASAQKSVYGSKQTLKNLSSAMDGGLWPVLGSFDEANGMPYVWRTVVPQANFRPCKGLSASFMPLSHGNHPNQTPYESSAYFINSDHDGKSFLILGDVEADSVSRVNYTRAVWQETATRISSGILSTIFIECSYRSSRSEEQLYGHLSPNYVFEEMRVLAGLLPCREGQENMDLRGRLKGLTIGIIHVKDPISVEELFVPSFNSEPYDPSLPEGSPSRTKRRKANTSAIPPLRASSEMSHTIPLALPEGMRGIILEELLALEAKEELGPKFLMLEQGMRIEL
ncbi:MAG: 3',5'-cyclic-nucleotide phosphodiesterase pde1 [Cyphobasidiales sp. Tagirdzhanova-0007]|nr:MAG: 3',5'-cyclic-nucleotide phosphodiesterase pde1 [Cyphobasidiales sp. Tagirdzhanova-0007]